MSDSRPNSLRRELGTLESYAILVGILVGAGIFAVTSDAGAVTGPSVVLGYVVLAPVVMATAVAYLVFLTTPLGLQPGGEVLHIERTFQNRTLTFVSAWLKCVSYLGAAAYLANALALNFGKLFGVELEHATQTALAVAVVVFFWFLHSRSVQWFGRLQVWMCGVLAIALVVLIVPGLFWVEADNLQPFLTGGFDGFCQSLPLLFFAYAGFESLAHSAGEVRDSQSQLPKVFVRGILLTTLIFVLMSLVAFGVLPEGGVAATHVPMSEAAAVYLPMGARELVTIGAIMAIATSINATLIVPARLAWSLANVGQLPKALGHLHPRRQTPDLGVAAGATLTILLILSGQLFLALRIATSALITLYTIHSFALLALPRRNPELFGEVTTRIPRSWQVVAAWLSIVALVSILAIQFVGDIVARIEKPTEAHMTTLELLLTWIVIGLVLSRVSRRSITDS